MKQRSEAVQQAEDRAGQAAALLQAATKQHSAQVGQLQVRLQEQEQAAKNSAADAQKSLARAQQASARAAVHAEQVRLNLSNRLCRK